MVKGVILVD
jgi:uncharacterized protein with GYD domain